MYLHRLQGVLTLYFAEVTTLLKLQLNKISVALVGEGRGVYRVLVGKPEGKRPLGRQRRRWEDNIKMDLQGVGGGCGDWMELVQDRTGGGHL